MCIFSTYNRLSELEEGSYLVKGIKIDTELFDEDTPEEVETDFLVKISDNDWMVLNRSMEKGNIALKDGKKAIVLHYVGKTHPVNIFIWFIQYGISFPLRYQELQSKFEMNRVHI